MVRNRALTEILDECLARMAAGDSPEVCLARYPDHAAALRPMLMTAAAIRRVSPPTADPTTIARGEERMHRALAAKVSRRSQRRTQRAFNLQRRLAARAATPWRAFVTVLLALMLLGAGLFITPELLPGTTRYVWAHAIITEASGEVMRLPAGEQTWVPVTVGDIILPGDRLRTGPEARIRFAFLDGNSSSVLGSDAEIAVVQLPTDPQGGDDVILLQVQGDAVHNIAASAVGLEVRTLVSSARARVAAFSVQVADEGATSIAVTSGQVLALSEAGEEQLIGHGQTLQIGPARGPEVGGSPEDWGPSGSPAASGGGNADSPPTQSDSPGQGEPPRASEPGPGPSPTEEPSSQGPTGSGPSWQWGRSTPSPGGR